MHRPQDLLNHGQRPMNFWEQHFSRLQSSLAAQIERIRAGSKHSTIKGASIEVVLRRVLGEYLPGHFSVRPGQLANSGGELSPQLDIMVYDGNAFPRLAVNEDSSVIVCCESVVAVVECKTYWDQEEVEKHYTATVNVECKRCEEFQDKELRAAYFLLFHESATPALSHFADADRCVGFYCLLGDRSWSSPFEQADFKDTEENVLQTFFQDLLMHCMRIGQVEIGTFENAYNVISKYVGWKAQSEEEA